MTVGNRIQFKLTKLGCTLKTQNYIYIKNKKINKEETPCWRNARFMLDILIIHGIGLKQWDYKT